MTRRSAASVTRCGARSNERAGVKRRIRTWPQADNQRHPAPLSAPSPVQPYGPRTGERFDRRIARKQCKHLGARVRVAGQSPARDVVPKEAGSGGWAEDDLVAERE